MDKDKIIKLLYSNNEDDILLGVEYGLAKYPLEGLNSILDRYGMNLQIFADMVRIRGGLAKEEEITFAIYNWWIEVATTAYKNYSPWPEGTYYGFSATGGRNIKNKPVNYEYRQDT